MQPDVESEPKLWLLCKALTVLPDIVTVDSIFFEVRCFAHSSPKFFAKLRSKDGQILLLRREKEPREEQMPICRVPMILARSRQVPAFDYDVYVQGGAPAPPAVQMFINSAVQAGHPVTVMITVPQMNGVGTTTCAIYRNAFHEKGLYLRWDSMVSSSHWSGDCGLQGSHLQLNWSALQKGSVWEFFTRKAFKTSDYRQNI